MRPSVPNLDAKPAPTAKPLRRLQSVVVGRPDTILLQDVARIRVLSGERKDAVCVRRIYVKHDVQLASFAANITHLEHRRTANALFYLQAVVEKIRCPEILV